MKFKIGQKVVALDNALSAGSQPRVKGGIYTVKDVVYCPKTGHQLINLGPSTDKEFFTCICGGKHDTYGLRWTISFKFAPVEEKGETMIEEIIGELELSK